jgi:folate-binding protein YgfZ
MVSNDVLALAPGESCDALLLTPKARVVATLRILRRGNDDYLLLTEPELGEVVRTHLLRARFAARCEIEPEEHESAIVFGAKPETPGPVVPTGDYGEPAWEVLDAGLEPTLDDQTLERLRIEAGTPLFGRDIDDRVLPAEAGLTERAVSFTKGCYPGQEPIARLHYRGHANRALRLLRVDGAPPAAEAEVVFEGKSVGRVTSAVAVDEGALALAYVRVEVPEGSTVEVEGRPARIVAPSREQ